ncbi:hypothetical protein DV738_g3513, partial [Chaetothyriales sp. CBS 135597]
MLDTICTFPLPADLFTQALHPSEPILSVGLSSGHVYTYRLPSLGDEDADSAADNVVKQIHHHDNQGSAVVNGVHNDGSSSSSNKNKSNNTNNNGPAPIISSLRRSSIASENGLGSIEQMWKTRRHKGSCRALVFNHDGSVSYSAGTDGLIKAFDTATGKVTWKSTLLPGASDGDGDADADAPSSMHALSPQALLLGTDNGKMYVYDLREPTGTRPSHDAWAPHGTEPVNGITPVPASAASTSGFPKQWVSVGGATLAVTDLRKGVLATSEDQEIELTRCVMVQGLKKGGTSVGEKVVVGQADGVVSLWERGVWGDLDERIVVDRAGEGIESLCQVPDGFRPRRQKNGQLCRMDEKLVAIGLASGLVRFARIGRNRVFEDWEVVHDELEGVTALGFDVCKRLITGGGQTIKIWTEAKGQPGGGRNANGDNASSRRKKRKRNKGKDKSGGIALNLSGVF